jgi:Holliday junction resolvasome RuvABC endonuclease subunit
MIKVSLPLTFPNYTVTVHEQDTPELLESFKMKWSNAYPLVVGIDPGSRHMGLTIIEKDITRSFEFLLNQSENPITRMEYVGQAVKECIHRSTGFALVEGSSHGEVYGQTQLAEARASAMLAMSEKGFEVICMPPSSIRKKVFGNGKTRGEDFWKKQIAPNAASSLVCALCGWKVLPSRWAELYGNNQPFE